MSDGRWNSERMFGELMARRDRGASVDDLLDAHPDRAARMREMLRLLDELDAAQRELGFDRSVTTRRTEEATAVDFARQSEGVVAEFRARTSERAAGQRYRTLEEIGRGGMGAVFRVRDEDLERDLAMKVIRRNRATPETVARFFDEAKVAGQLDHPGIVPVHELGIDAEGEAYFTMKLVEGRTLQEVFDDLAAGEDWTQTKVLGLLQRVCEAMAYAHDKGVIHRDLKPANVMIGRFGEVYVMDWGLARRLDATDGGELDVGESDVADVADVTAAGAGADARHPSPLYTRDGNVVGTPMYMSPEQALGKSAEMGPHSDIYSLGGMLYQLLAGHMPYAGTTDSLRPHDVWERVKAGPPVALRAVAPTAPAELLSICEKAMRWNWRDRYRSMAELGADLSAYLEGRVVRAHATGVVPEFAMWVRRNRALAVTSLAAVVVVVALAVGFALVVAGKNVEVLATSAELLVARNDALANAAEADVNAQRASENAERALTSEHVAEQKTVEADKSAALAQREARHARGSERSTRSMLSFIEEMFELQDPRRALGETITVKQVLDSGAARIGGSLPNDPVLRASLMEMMGGLYESLGLLDEAVPLTREALRLYLEQSGGEYNEISVSTAHNLAYVLTRLSLHEESEALFRVAYEGSARLEGPEHESALNSLFGLATAIANQSRHVEALALFEECNEIARRTLPPDSELRLATEAGLMQMYGSLGRYDGIETLLETYASILELHGERHPDVLAVATRIGVFYLQIGRSEEAEDWLNSTLVLLEQVLGPDHLDTLLAVYSLSECLERFGRVQESEALLRRIDASSLDRLHALRIRARMGLGRHLHRRGEFASAEVAYVDALADYRAVVGDEHDETLQTLAQLGVLYQQMGRLDESLEIGWEALETRRRVLPRGHPKLRESVQNVATTLRVMERFEELAPLAQELLKLTPQDHPERKLLEQALVEIEQEAKNAAANAGD